MAVWYHHFRKPPTDDSYLSSLSALKGSHDHNTFHCFLPVIPKPPTRKASFSALTWPTKRNIFVRKSLGLIRKMVCTSSCPEVSSYKELHVNTILDIG